MATTLMLFDETGPQSFPTGDTVTLQDNGQVTFNGDAVKSLFLSRLQRGDSPAQVFHKLNGWSNGYASLREKEA